MSHRGTDSQNRLAAYRWREMTVNIDMSITIFPHKQAGVSRKVSWNKSSMVGIISPSTTDYAMCMYILSFVIQNHDDDYDSNTQLSQWKSEVESLPLLPQKISFNPVLHRWEKHTKRWWKITSEPSCLGVCAWLGQQYNNKTWNGKELYGEKTVKYVLYICSLLYNFGSKFMKKSLMLTINEFTWN